MTYYKEPRVRIFRDWVELVESIEDIEKRGLFIKAVMEYAFENKQPNFIDKKLIELWERTNVRRYDEATNKEGWIKVWKRKRK